MGEKKKGGGFQILSLQTVISFLSHILIVVWNLSEQFFCYYFPFVRW